MLLRRLQVEMMKTEVRNPKPERNPKSEIRMAATFKEMRGGLSRQG